MKIKNVIITDEEKLNTIINLTKERCFLLTDFIEQAGYFFTRPVTFDEASILHKWDDAKKAFFLSAITAFSKLSIWATAAIEDAFKNLAAEHSIKVGELQMILRVMLVGSKKGPAVFEIAHVLGADETAERIRLCMQTLGLN